MRYRPFADALSAGERRSRVLWAVYVYPDASYDVVTIGLRKRLAKCRLVWRESCMSTSWQVRPPGRPETWPPKASPPSWRGAGKPGKEPWPPFSVGGLDNESCCSRRNRPDCGTWHGRRGGRCSDVPTEDLCTGNVCAGNMPARSLRSGDLRTGDLCTKDLSTCDLRPSHLRTHRTGAEDLPAGHLSHGSPTYGNLRPGNLLARYFRSEGWHRRRGHAQGSDTRGCARMTRPHETHSLYGHFLQ